MSWLVFVLVAVSGVVPDLKSTRDEVAARSSDAEACSRCSRLLHQDAPASHRRRIAARNPSVRPRRLGRAEVGSAGISRCSSDTRARTSSYPSYGGNGAAPGRLGCCIRGRPATADAGDGASILSEAPLNRWSLPHFLQDVGVAATLPLDAPRVAPCRCRRSSSGGLRHIGPGSLRRPGSRAA